MKLRRALSLAAEVFVLFLFVRLLFSPQTAAQTIKNALVFCAQTLVPSLFVFIVLADRMAGMRLTALAAQKTGCGFMLWLLGSLCGVPVGAVLANGLYRSGAVNKRRAEYLIAFTNNAGVSFLLGYVGAGLFGNIYAGAKLTVCQLVSTAATAVLLKFIMFGKARPSPRDRKRFREPPSPPRSAALPAANRPWYSSITGAAYSMLAICACAVFFSAVSQVTVALFGLSGAGEALLRSALEFSSGCACAANLPYKTAFVLCAFACGQTGLSVAVQVRAVTGGALSMRPYLAGKAINCAIFMLLAFFIG
ncbi:MAG: hypothetical protein IJQ53_05470 [Clostridia bacterium]|nr:hypothetical protein [Clostridia bacterium]